MKFININKTNLHLLDIFYIDVYAPAFSDVNERETLENLYYYINAKKENYDYKIILCCDDDEIIGGCILDYFYSTKTIVIEFIVIRSDVRTKGLGKELFNYACSLYEYEQVVIEINDPTKLTKDDSLSYLYFWQQLGFKKLDIIYIQPPLNPDKEPVYCLWLACKSKKDYIDKKVIMSILADYFRYAMKIAEPTQCRQYQKIENSIKNKKIYLQPINNMI